VDPSSLGGSNAGTGEANLATGRQGGTSAAGGATTTSTVPTGACRNTRLTQFTDNNEQLGCGYRRAVATIPKLVPDRMYIAMAEPFRGSSYNGSPGESCGECWELTTTKTTTVVIVADLCPIEGNIPCFGRRLPSLGALPAVRCRIPGRRIPRVVILQE
jgi:hypothetical protein